VPSIVEAKQDGWKLSYRKKNLSKACYLHAWNGERIMRTVNGWSVLEV